MKIASFAFAACAFALATSMASGALAQSSVPGSPSNPTKPKVTAVPTPPPPPGGNRYTSPTLPPGPGIALRKPGGPTVVDDLAGQPNQAHADLPPGPGTYHCASQHACAWLDSKCTKAGGGMSQNPPDSPGSFPTQTCTIN
jgi:hypothetical protein